MTRVHLGVLAVCIACSVLLPIPARASGCSPNFYHTDQGWLEKWFTTQPYKSQQDRLVQVYSAIPSITTTVLMAQAQGARDRWESASFNSTPVFTYLFCTSQPTGGTYVIIVSTHQEYENLMFSLTGQTDEAAIAFTVRGFYPFNGNVVNSKTVIDGSLQWATTCASGACGSTRFSLLGTVVHEWGHALALDHPSALPGACDFATVMDILSTKGSTSKETLKPSDAPAISHLYLDFPVSADLTFNAYGSATEDTLYWTETTSRTCWYNLSVSDNCMGPYTPVGRVIGVTATNHYSFITPATYSRDYFYRLTVEQNGVIVDSARTVSQRTSGLPAAEPLTPTWLTADAAQVAGRVALSWQPSGGADGYYVYRWINSLPDCLDANVTIGQVTATSMVDSTAMAGFSYAYRVRAYNSMASSGVTDQATAQVLSATISGTDPLACPNAGSWTAQPAGGTGTYSYEWHAVGVSAVLSTSQTLQATNPAGSGSFELYCNVTSGAASVQPHKSVTEQCDPGGGGDDGGGGGDLCLHGAGGCARFSRLMVISNPVRGDVHLAVSLAAPAPVDVRAYDISGREVAVVHQGMASVGRTVLTWNTQGLPVGVYQVRMRVEDVVRTAQAIVVR